MNDFNLFPEDGLLGELVGEAPGPTVAIVAAIHGNEPAGVHAVQAVLRRLAVTGLARGRLVARIGHPTALAAGQRHHGHDLNRMWGQAAPPAGPDARAYHALAAWLAALEGPAVVIDLHTTSAGGPPFALAIEAPGNVELGAALPFPLVFGLLEQVPGTLAEWATRRGHRSLAIEAGQHGDPHAVAIHAHALEVLLHHLGCTEAPAPRPELPGAALLRVIYTHHITAADGFVMEPGFTSFQPVRPGTLLAHDRRGEVRAPVGGRLLMPLYQALGSEGFFIASERDNPPDSLTFLAKDAADP